MADVAVWRLGRAFILGVLGAAAAASCGGETDSDVNEDAPAGGKATGGSAASGGSQSGGVSSGGAPSGGSTATFGGSSFGGGSFGGAPSLAGAPGTGGATGGNTATGGAKATGGAASGGAVSSGGSSDAGAGGSGADIPDDSCFEGCEVAPAGNPLCGEESFTWVCFGADGVDKFNVPECGPLATQVPRFCCSKDFRPCE